MIPFVCDKCNHTFCISHRHPFDHDCTKELPQKKFAVNNIFSGAREKRLEMLAKQKAGIKQ